MLNKLLFNLEIIKLYIVDFLRYNCDDSDDCCRRQ